MQLNRRGFIQTAGCLATSAAVAFPFKSSAQILLNDLRIDTLSDGYLNLPGDLFFAGLPEEELSSILESYDQSRERVMPPCNVTLLRNGERTILFDVGSGPNFSENSGVLIDSLEALDLAPEDITDVLFTHAHPDHLWGLLDDFDDLAFPQARYMIGKTEWEYWMNPDTVAEVGQARASFAVGAKRRLESIEDAVTFFRDGEEVLPGVAARKTFGHTPGHMAFEVASGSDSVMIVGDSIGNHHVAFERPQWYSGADQDQELAAESRVKLLDQMAHTQMRLIGFHLSGGGIGRVEKSGDRYIFVGDV